MRYFKIAITDSGLSSEEVREARPPQFFFRQLLPCIANNLTVIITITVIKYNTVCEKHDH